MVTNKKLNAQDMVRIYIFYLRVEECFPCEGKFVKTLEEILLGGYMRFHYNPGGIGVGNAVDIQVNEEKNRASGPAWNLIITDDNYAIETLPDGTIMIVSI